MSVGASIGELRATMSRVADGLYRIDADPECRLLRDPDSLDGVSEALARELTDAFERVWVEYPLLSEMLDAASPDAPLPPDAANRVARLDDDVRRILGAADQVAEAWRTALPRADELRETLDAVEADARRIGLGDDHDLAHARRMVEHLGGQIARDPLSVDPSPATRQVVQVADRVAELARLHDSLPADLRDARATLTALADAIAAGREALTATRERIASPTGLLQPLDPAALDDGELALRPWLERVEAEAAAGRWLAAARGLQRWRAVADGWAANADRVVQANRAPVARRNELRGLLDAYRAKAAATGRAEGRTLTAAMQRARDALFTRPCDLEEAEELVQEYARLVSGG
ncbi:MAG TPA: hypothetical protein VM345_09655 [Acidimicrobiales bacterium]|nr:hypothetical protein [Acidimicrobiales bacterium]